jgi:hypothetical protein
MELKLQSTSVSAVWEEVKTACDTLSSGLDWPISSNSIAPTGGDDMELKLQSTSVSVLWEEVKTICFAFLSLLSFVFLTLFSWSVFQMQVSISGVKLT